MQTVALNAVKIAGQTGGTVPQPRLVRAAHEFEAMMMKELLKPMTGEDDLTEDGDEDTAGSVLGEFATEALGQALSAGGGFGIAHEIVRSISHSGNTTDSGKVTGILHENTRIKALE